MKRYRFCPRDRRTMARVCWRFAIMLAAGAWLGAAPWASAATNTWEQLSPTPTARWNPTSFTDCTNKTISANPQGRAFSGSVYGNGKIFYRGGGHHGYPANDVDLYDIAANQWVPDTTQPECIAPVCNVDGNGSVQAPNYSDNYPLNCQTGAATPYNPSCLWGSCLIPNGPDASKTAFRCAGGMRDGLLCTSDPDCTGGGTCSVGIAPTTPGVICTTCHPYTTHTYQRQAYNPVRGKFFIYSESGTYEWDPVPRAWTRLTIPPPSSGDFSNRLMMWDAARQRMLFFQVGGGNSGVYAFNYDTNAWTLMDAYLPTGTSWLEPWGFWNGQVNKFVVSLGNSRWFVYDPAPTTTCPTGKGACAWTEITASAPTDVKTAECSGGKGISPCFTTGITYDAINQRTIVLTQELRPSPIDPTKTANFLALWAYDALNNTWQPVPTSGGSGIGKDAGYPNQLHYDPITASLYLVDLNNYWITGTGGTVRTWKIHLNLGNLPTTPALSLSAAPASVTMNGSSSLTWSGTNLASCTASSSPANILWSGTKSSSGGSEVINTITANTTFTLNCTGTDGSPISRSTTVSVTPVPTSIVVTPNPATITASGTQQFTATDQSGQPLSGVTVMWNSSDFSAAIIDPTGLATGKNIGTTTLSTNITASSGGVTSLPAVLTVNSVPSTGGAGLLAAYAFDEGSGATTQDSSGNARTATLSAAIWTPQGKYGPALSFDGTTSKATVADFPPPSSVTVEAWIYPTATDTGDHIIVSKHNSEYGLRIFGNGFLSGSAGGASLTDNTFDFRSAGHINQWYHVAYTFESVAKVHMLYRNGVVVASGPNTATITDQATPLWIGRHSQLDFGSFQGRIDEVRLYGRALSLVEISQDMTTPIGSGAPPVSCAFNLTPSSLPSVPAAGQPGTITVTNTAGTGCTWTASSSVPWMTISSPATGGQVTGNGTVNYTVAANLTTASRSGTLTVAGQLVSVTQLAAAGGGGALAVSLTQPPANANIAGTVTITADVTGGSSPVQVQVLLKPAGGQPQPLGPVLMAAPYTLAWDTTTVSDGAYELSASAQESGGVPVSATPVNVTVSNTSSGVVPTNLRQTARLANQIDLAWDAPVGISGLAGYRVYQDGQFLMRTSSTTFLVIGLVPNTSYAFSVEAYDTANTIFARSAPLTESTLTSRVLQVGPTRTLKKISDAANTAQNGDTIEIDAADYFYDNAIAAWRANNLTIRGVGGRPHIDAHARSINSRGVWAVYGKNTVIENVELSGGHDTPGAGIRLDGSGLVLRRSVIHDNDDGILGGGNVFGVGDVVIEYTEFYNNGDGTGQTHNVYIGHARSLTFRHNYSHGAVIGHELKSRAHENYVLYNRLTNEQIGSASVQVELPCGGPSYVIGNLIQKSSYADSAQFVKYAAEFNSTNGGCPAPTPSQELYVVNNTFVNNYGASGQLVWVRNTPIVKLLNNLFIGGGTVFASSPTGALATQLNNLATSAPLLVDQSNYDYHLTGGSPAINQGAAPGMANGFSLTPTMQYAYPTQSEIRPVTGALDLGAYELNSTVTPAPFDFSLMLNNGGSAIVTSPFGRPASQTVIVTRTSGNAVQPVTLQVAAVTPINNVNATLSAASCIPNPTCAVLVTAIAPLGTPSNTFYSLFVNGTVGGVTHSLSAPLTIFAAPVLYVPLNESSGNPVDAIGTVSGITLPNGGSWQPTAGQMAGALQLDGVDDYIAVPSHTNIDLSSSSLDRRTASAWFKVTDKSLITHKQLIYEEGGPAKGLNLYIYGDKLYAGGWDTTATPAWAGTFLSTATIQSGRWHHAAVVLENSSSGHMFTLYLDGQSMGTGLGAPLSPHPDGIGIGAVNATTLFHDGAATGTATHAFGGLLDDVRVYNRVLSVQEIKQQIAFFTKPAPMLTLTATPSSVSSGGSTSVAWSGTNVDTTKQCDADGLSGWTGKKAAAGGSQTVGPLTSNTTLTLTCTGVNGLPVSQTVTVAVTGSAATFDFVLGGGQAISVAAGNSGTTIMTASLISGNAQSVTFSASGLPSGATASFSPASCLATCTTTMTVQTASATPSGTVTVTGTSGSLSRTVTVPLTVTAQRCTISLAAASTTLLATAAPSNTLSFTATPATCTWTATVPAGSFLTPAATSGTGTGSAQTLNYAVTANTGTTTRTSTLMLNGQTYTVNQAAPVVAPPACTYNVSPLSVPSVVAAGESKSITVTATPSPCTGSWTATSNDGFITINSGSSGTGNGMVSYTVTPNPTTASRSGTLTIAGQMVSVTQLASAASGAVLQKILSGYLGGSGNEQVRDVAFDAHGNIYLTGGTNSPNFPTTAGAFRRTLNAGPPSNPALTCTTGPTNGVAPLDIFVMKLDPVGRLVWSTLIGGPCYDRAYGIEIDPRDGNIILSGRAGRDFPTTPGVIQPNFNGYSGGPVYGDQNALIAKLKADGSQLLWATYLGTANGSRDVVVDANGTIFAPAGCQVVQSGQTACPFGWFAANPTGTFRSTPRSAKDGALIKMREDGAAVLAATYGMETAGGTPSIRLDSAGNPVYLTQSNDATAVTTPGSFHPTFSGGALCTPGGVAGPCSDMYVAKFSKNLDALTWASWIGGQRIEFSETHGLAIDGQDNVIVAATTRSSVAEGFTVTPGTIQQNFAGIGTGGLNYIGDGFITKIAPDGSRVLASTYFGGPNGEGIEGVAVDNQGNIYVSGGTYSSTLPGIPSGFGGVADLFVAKLSPDLTQVLSGAFVGGNNVDYGRSSMVDQHTGTFVAVGIFQSTNFVSTPTPFPTPTPFHTGLSGPDDGGVAIFAVASAPVAPTLSLSASPTTVTSGGSTTLTWSSTNLSTCAAFDGWTGVKPTVGMQNSGSLLNDTTFTLACTGTDGSAISRSVSVAVVAAPTTCTVSLASAGTTLPATASSTNAVNLTATPNGCTWSATVPSGSFLTPAATGGTGTGSAQTLAYAVTANTGTTTRTSTLTLNGQTYTVTQSAPATPTCTFTVSPLTVPGVLASGETKSVAVTPSASSCDWTVATNASFITLTSDASRRGSGTVNYTVAANPTTTSRTGTLTIAGQTVTVTQQSVSLLPGDLDANGLRDNVDLQLLVNVLLGLETNPQIIQRADLDADDTPTILDLQRLVNLLLGS